MELENRIKKEFLLEAQENKDAPVCRLDTDTDIHDAYLDLVENDMHYEYEEGFRCSGEDTNIESDWSRHYESKSVARKLRDGQWIGWTYWSGGGKHGEPEAVEWMGDAYFLDVIEEERLVIVREFSKIKETSPELSCSE